MQSRVANTTYYVWLWCDSTHNFSPGCTFDTSASVPATPGAQYNKKKLIGAVRLDASSNIRSFFMFASGGMRRVIYTAAESTLRVVSAGTATALTDLVLTDWIPPNLAQTLLFLVQTIGNNSGDYCQIHSAAGGVSISTNQCTRVFASDSATGSVEASSDLLIPYGVDNPRVAYILGASGMTTYIWIQGYEFSLY
jgi:hypothetical protein